MTALDHFQLATCDISAGNRISAVKHLDAAISQIDRDGVDIDLRDDLSALRETVIKQND